MESKVVARISEYGHQALTSLCPNCGSPLVVTYRESQLHALEFVLACSADCGYVQKQRTRDRTPAPTAG